MSYAADDIALAQHCIAGDASAQREFVQHYTPLVWSLCLRAGLPHADVRAAA